MAWYKYNGLEFLSDAEKVLHIRDLNQPIWHWFATLTPQLKITFYSTYVNTSYEIIQRGHGSDICVISPMSGINKFQVNRSATGYCIDDLCFIGDQSVKINAMNGASIAVQDPTKELKYWFTYNGLAFYSHKNLLVIKDTKDNYIVEINPSLEFTWKTSDNHWAVCDAHFGGPPSCILYSFEHIDITFTIQRCNNGYFIVENKGIVLDQMDNIDDKPIPSTDKPVLSTDKPVEQPVGKAASNEFINAPSGIDIFTTSDPVLNRALSGIIKGRVYKKEDPCQFASWHFVGTAYHINAPGPEILHGKFTNYKKFLDDIDATYELEGMLTKNGLFTGEGIICLPKQSEHTFEICFVNHRMAAMGLSGVKHILNRKEMLDMSKIERDSEDSLHVRSCEIRCVYWNYSVKITLNNPLPYYILLEQEHPIICAMHKINNQHLDTIAQAQTKLNDMHERLPSGQYEIIAY
jgi:hypothetical protein